MNAGNGMLYVGIDTGSTTVKAVVMNAAGEVLWKRYERHNTRQAALIRDFLADIRREYPAADLRVFVTGSGSRAVAPLIDASYIQEVNAVTHAVEKLHPEAGSVVEIGGQDAKVVIWKRDQHGRRSTLTFMNDKCAGGTGATLDKILGKIGLTHEEAAAVSIEGRTLHRIAAKCGVFAETDVVGLLKSGICREEIIVSLLAAVVQQNMEVLVRGNILRDRVLLLGGPHRYFPALAEIWRRVIPESWEMHKWESVDGPIDELVLVPGDAEFFAAMGAVFFGLDSERLAGKLRDADHRRTRMFSGLSTLDEYLAGGRLRQLEAAGRMQGGLVDDPAEVEAFSREYSIPDFAEPDFPAGAEISAWLGIDGGSTSSKIALIDESGSLLYRDYVLSAGNPIEDVREMTGRLLAWRDRRGPRLTIRGTAVTGYASSIIREAFDIDRKVVETVAHMRSAVALHGEVDVICDVGGQDIKVLFLRHGRVVDFRLNTQCSAGNGYFLQGMAAQFGVPVERYAELAFSARKAPCFNYGCAVFMEQDRVNFQQLGWTAEEIMAGLAIVLPSNIWNYVVQEQNLARFGRRFVLQGGTQRNLAAVKAQVDFIRNKVPDAEVLVNRYAEISGAMGAALELAQRGLDGESTFIGLEAASRVVFATRNDAATRCAFCANRCPRTFIDIESGSGRRVCFISGHCCDKGRSEDASEMRRREADRRGVLERVPNLVSAAESLVFADNPAPPLPADGESWPSGSLGGEPAVMRRSSASSEELRRGMTIGIPRLLNLYYYAPFFNAYLNTLGVGRVIYSEPTSAGLWERGNKWGSIDPCFPAKVAPAHVYDLLAKREATHVLFPMITHLESTVVNTLGNTACVIQMGTPEVVHAAFTRDRNLFEEAGCDYWKPLLRMDLPAEAIGELHLYFKDRLHITEEENRFAAEQGFAAMERYLAALRRAGTELINDLIDSDRVGILVIGHPYHHDPGLNHGIPEEFQARGFPVLCIESLPVSRDFLGPLFADEPDAPLYDISGVWRRNFNRNTNIKIWAARVAAKHPNMAVIDFSSFKCGHDAPTYSYVDGILDSTETPHFLFHDIDQNRPRATFEIRIQTIEYFLRLEERLLRAATREPAS